MTGTDDEFQKKLLATFREEAEEYINTITEGLLELEKSGPETGSPVTERVYRTIHSLKGAARAVNVKEIELVCQNLENVFAAIKKGSYWPDDEAFDIFHNALRVIRVHIQGAHAQEPSSSEIISSIRGLLAPNKSAGQQANHNIRTTDTILPHTSPVIRVVTSAGPDTDSSRIRDPSSANSLTRTEPADPSVPVRPSPRKEEPYPGTGSSATVRISAHKLDRLIAGSDDLLTTRLFITHRMRELQEMMTRFSQWRWNHAMVSSDLYLLREAIAGTKTTTLPPELVVPLRHMLEFMEYDREFMTYLQHDLGAHIRATELDRAALETSTSEISDLIHDAVLVPISDILLPFSGFVREYSRSTGKRVDLVIEGEEIEMDRRILESLKDPLMHLINNSIDHGIEYPDIRAGQHKPARGIVRIRIVPVSGSKVGIEVSDDGAGIDCNKVRNSAVKNGIITKREAGKLTDEEAIWLIFRSGLSVKPDVTDISGRGLGLAIVEDTVTRLGGNVILTSQLGAGTSITMRVPVRLATFRGVVVRSGSHKYVLPMQQVRQVFRAKPDATIFQSNRPTLTLNGEVISIIRLTDALGMTRYHHTSEIPSQVPIIIIAYGAGQIACMVDEVLQVQEIVVRPLGSQLHRVKRITGAAILGDGSIAIVLDPIELIQEAIKTDISAPQTEKPGAVLGRVLVVEDSVTSRMFLANILEQRGHEVVTARDGMEAFAMLKDDKFDMVVSDVDMPRMNGFTLTEKIRADTRLAYLPIVLVTSLDSKEDRAHGIAVGADVYMEKSGFEKERFLSVIHELLQGDY
ncbi:MAG: chemotaxis protein CheW [Methanomicrobiales archaeon]